MNPWAKGNPRYKANQKMKGGKRTVEQREADKAFCANLFVKGYTYRQIADKLNEANRENGLEYTVTFKTVFNDINAVLAEWKKQQFTDISNYMQLELKKLDKIEIELWTAWENSKGSKRKTKIKNGTINNGIATGGELAERSLETTNGDPRYLDLLLKVQERRAKLLGYNAPMRVNVYNEPPKEENPAETKYDINALPIDMVVEMAYKLQDAEFKKRQDVNNGTEEANTTSEKV